GSHGDGSGRPLISDPTSGWRELPRGLFHERRLAGADPAHRLNPIEPFRAVDFGEFLSLSGSRRPFHREPVASNRVRIDIAVEDPRDDALPAREANRRQLDEGTIGNDARLFFELATRGRKRILVRRDLPFRDRPSSEVLLGPERSSRVDEKKFIRAVSAARHEETRALLGHPRILR